MPLVSDDFVKNAEALAKSVPELQAKIAEQEKAAAVAPAAAPAQPQISESLIEATVDTLISQGLIPANEKAAAVANLKDPEQILQALNKTAQFVRPEPMGSPATEKAASSTPSMAESDRTLLSRLGFNV